MDQNLIPLSILTTTIHRQAKRAVTSTEKHCLFEVVEGLGTAITAQDSSFNGEEFYKACGVNPSWATVAAA